ncbi:pullulanase-type alpha-1,6-glucosidase [Egicoccus sp. AB-alg6-2]|uniref:pullulanase-type alpha-1,6-glucosidase n=1 Tax=Egicoccus sp. AB-alg6-2 TaxID=3242692 RepID=UPI00359EB397
MTAADRTDVRARRAHFVTASLVAWPWSAATGLRHRLHHAASGGLRVEGGTVHGATSPPIELSVVAGGMPGTITRRDGWRHLAGFTALAVPDTPHLDAWLQGQLVVAAVDGDDRVVAATGLQFAGVIDERFATQRPLGVVWRGGVPDVHVWAPTARRVRLLRYDPADRDQPREIVAMTNDRGVWSVSGAPSWDRDLYRYEVEVYAPDTDRIETNLVTDPWSLSLAADSTHSQIVRLEDADLLPHAWDPPAKPTTTRQRGMVVYELHVRDFSIGDVSVPPRHRGRYGAFSCDDTTGVQHLRGLADAGVTHLHLLPTFDFATVPDREADRVSPSIEPPDDPASERPRTIQQAGRDHDGFNWGYDPWHWTVPEGSYASDPDGVTRILEFRQMVRAINRTGLRVVVDVVYNHTHAAGQDPASVLDRLVPGYHHRLDADGRVETSSCCPNTATEHAMTARLVVDSVLTWARAYRVDGFRFDLMGHHPRSLMVRIRAALDALTSDADGVVGRDIVLYGEGWEFGEVAGDARFVQATQRNLGGTGIGSFDDRLRDAVRGGSPFTELRTQGFATGAGVDPNETDTDGPAVRADRARRLADLVRLGLAGSLAEYRFETADGRIRAGRDLVHDDAPAGYTAAPMEQVAYVSAHDNETLFDAVQAKLPLSTPMAQRVRAHNLALSVVAFAQGTPFFHAGSDLLRSKSLDRDSYASGDWFNRLDLTGRTSNWGVGLPPDHGEPERDDVVRMLLRALPAPTAGDIARCRDHLREVLRVRRSSPRFGLPDAAAVRAQLRFHATGPDAPPGVVAMSLTGGRSSADELVVVFNASLASWSLIGEGGVAAGGWELHPMLRSSTDEVVRTATYDARSHRFAVPARTTAVFVRPAPLAGSATDR